MNDTCCECGIRVGDFACVMCIEALETKLVEARLSHFVMGLAWAGFYASCNLAFVDTAADRDEWKRRAEHKDADTLDALKKGRDALGQCIAERDTNAMIYTNNLGGLMNKLTRQDAEWLAKHATVVAERDAAIARAEVMRKRAESHNASLGVTAADLAAAHDRVKTLEAALREWCKQLREESSAAEVGHHIAAEVERRFLNPIAAPGASEPAALTPEQFEHVVDMIENPRPPTPALVDLFKNTPPAPDRVQLLERVLEAARNHRCFVGTGDLDTAIAAVDAARKEKP
jgi:hypothetical protein